MLLLCVFNSRGCSVWTSPDSFSWVDIRKILLCDIEQVFDERCIPHSWGFRTEGIERLNKSLLYYDCIISCVLSLTKKNRPMTVILPAFYTCHTSFLLCDFSSLDTASCNCAVQGSYRDDTLHSAIPRSRVKQTMLNSFRGTYSHFYSRYFIYLLIKIDICHVLLRFEKTILHNATLAQKINVDGGRHLCFQSATLLTFARVCMRERVYVSGHLLK